MSRRIRLLVLLTPGRAGLLFGCYRNIMQMKPS
jgi:hypothetical protein